MSKHSLVKNTMLLSIGTILNKGIVFLMIPLFSSWLTTEDYGIFDLICTYVTMLIPFLSLSSGEGMFRLGIESKDKKKYISSTLIIYTVALILFGVGATFLYLYLKNKLLIFFYIMLVNEMYNKFFQTFLRTIKKIKIYSFISILSTCVTFLSVTILIKVFDLGLIGIILGYAIGYFVGNIIIFVLTKFYKYITLKLNFKYFKEIIKYSLPLIPNSVSWWVINASDRSIINYFLGSALNGIYAISYKIPNLCTSIFSVFGIAWQEETIITYKNKDKEIYYNKVYNRMINILLSLCTIILSCNFILFDYIFDIKYIEAHLYTPILVSGVIFIIISQYFGGIQLSLKQPFLNGITTVIGAIVNILVNLLLIKYIGLYAAAISTLVSTLTIIVLRKIIISKHIKIKYEKKNYKYIVVYLYISLCAYIYTKIPFILNILNMLLSIIVFLYSNKDMLNKIKRRCIK